MLCARRQSDPHRFCSLSTFFVTSYAMLDLEESASRACIVQHRTAILIVLQFNHVFVTCNVKLDFEEHASRACFVQDGRVTITVSAV